MSPDARIEPGQADPPSKRRVLVVGGFVITAATAVVVTLAFTHRAAVTENAIAYVNGFTDGYGQGYWAGLIEGLDVV